MNAVSAKLRGLAIFTAILVPVGVALGGSFLLAREAFQLGQSEAQTMRMQEVRAQSRLLLENVWSSLENVKVRARLQFSHPELGSTDVDPAIQSVTRYARAPSAMLERELRDTGFGILSENTRSLGLVFAAGASTGGANPTLLLAEVDPVRAFSGFTRWSTRRESGRLRGYLIASSGKVLVHSERPYSGLDFGNTEVFQKALRSLFKGERVSGIATFTAIDLRPAITSYAAVGNLPLAVVVERVIQPAGAAVLKQGEIPAVLLGAILLLLCAISYAIVRKLSAERPALALEPALELTLDRMTSARAQAELERGNALAHSASISSGLSSGLATEEDLPSRAPFADPSSERTEHPQS